MTTAKVYKVGGAVRDEMLGVKNKDLDYAIECESFDAMRQYIIESGGEIFLETPKYFTIRAKVPSLGVADFVLCRKDGFYKDGRRPETVEVGTIYDDLARRDFTINAMAVSTDGQMLDPYNGKADLERLIIRCVRNPYDRFEEDGLRILRAMRFAITKRMDLHETIIQCLCDPKVVKLLRIISIDRKRDELYKCFKHDTFATLNFLEQFGLVKEELFLQNRELWLEPTSKL